jgi:hypothetical protein
MRTPPHRPTANARRRMLACQILAGVILDGIEDDTLVLGLTIATVNPAGEYGQHSAGLREPGVKRIVVPDQVQADLADLVDRCIDLADVEAIVPDSPGWLP